MLDFKKGAPLAKIVDLLNVDDMKITYKMLFNNKRLSSKFLLKIKRKFYNKYRQ